MHESILNVVHLAELVLEDFDQLKLLSALTLDKLIIFCKFSLPLVVSCSYILEKIMKKVLKEL